MLINLQVASVASKRDYLGCLGCLEEMPSGGGFEGDYLGCLGCLEEMPSGSGFEGDYFGRRVASK